MSFTETEGEVTELAERPDLVREFVATALEVNGRTVDVRLVPFGEVARVADPPDYRPYQEEWLAGAFDHQLNAANRIHAKYGHSGSVLDVVGHGISLRSEPGDGYHISAKIHETVQGETALALLRDGALPCVSLEARPVKSVRTAAGVVQRVRANLSGFAFCRQGAFSGARVLAIREQDLIDDVVMDESLLPVEIDPDLFERCRRLGVKLPDRMAEVLLRAFTEQPWDGSVSRWGTADAYCSATAIDLNPSGKTKTKDLCHLPFKEPGSGDVNVNGVRAALTRIGQGFPTGATQQERDTARVMLERLLAQFNKQSS